ncbi:MAG: hypothetical protein LBF97_01715 [Elusimicrobiota bacterium]|jgi:hypothetical protein|nr:hypothetical protein [Elusimicrobiota bacterium]
MIGSKTTEQFIKQAKEVHGDKYDYSLVEYINNYTKIKIICPEHGVFEQIPKHHLNGSKCKKCINKKRSLDKTYTLNIFIQKAKEVHGDKYDYSLVEYINSETKIKIICPIHGVFEQTPHLHIRGSGCRKCYNKKISKRLSKTTEQFIKQAKEVHGDKYDYSLVEYKDERNKIKIICKKHGVFEQQPIVHLIQKCGCPICNESKGEKEVFNILLEKNINFIIQHKFEDCKNKRKLPFDFYLPEHNMCIEYQGIQHYKPKFGLDEFNKTILRDKIKKEYCEKNNIKLIEIRYNENIKEKLNGNWCTKII